jgi:hypothetical protein
MVHFLLDNLFFSMATKMLGRIRIPDPAGSVINWPPGYGYWSVIQDYGATDLEPLEKVLHMFLCLLGPDSLVRGMDPNSSIIKQK